MRTGLFYWQNEQHNHEVVAGVRNQARIIDLDVTIQRLLKERKTQAQILEEMRVSHPTVTQKVSR